MLKWKPEQSITEWLLLPVDQIKLGIIIVNDRKHTSQTLYPHTELTFADS